MNFNLWMPVAIVLFIAGCDGGKESTVNDNESYKLVNDAMQNMVAVDSGEFLMGDFGSLVGDKIPLSINSDDKKLHKVILDGFMISKYKVTNEEFNKYIKLSGKTKLPLGLGERHPSLLSNNVSVSVPWQMAKDYCLWLGEQSGKKVDLPTEAQWEYAARSKGKYFAYATDDGAFIEGKNVPNEEQLSEYTEGLYLPIYPIGKYPPNPLGLYDMGLSGAEWVNDWYEADYYSHSELKNPQGPNGGKKKVRRGNVGGDVQYALTIFRQSALPVPVLEGSKYEEDGIGPSYVFRCVENK